MSYRIHAIIASFCLFSLSAIAQETPDSISQTAMDTVIIMSFYPDSGETGLPVYDTMVTEENKVETGYVEFDLPQNQVAWYSLRKELNIENDEDFSGFSLLDTVLEKYKVFFIGENHQFRHSNQKLHLKMLKYLYYNAGVRTLIVEFGVSSGWLMNEYVQTGDSALFEIFNTYAYKSWINFISQLREWNLSLDSSERIQIVGIDVERFETIPLKVLSLQLPDKKPAPEKISLSVESLRSIVAYFDYQAKKKNENDGGDYFWTTPTYDVENHVDQLLLEYDGNREAYREYIGEGKFPLFDTVMVSLRDNKTYRDYTEKRLPQAPIYREKYMFDQFKRLLDEKPESRFFGQFGRCHVGTLGQEEACAWHNFNSIAQRINHSNDTLINGKVCSIASFYPNSDAFEDEVNEISELRNIADNVNNIGLTLFNMNNGDFRFGKLTEMYQFIIINNYTVEEDEAAEEDSDYVANRNYDGGEKTYLHLSFGREIRQYNINGLNALLNQSDYYSTFLTNRSQNIIQIGIYWPGIYNSLGLTFSSRETISSAISGFILQELGGWGAQYSFGFGNLQNLFHYSTQLNLRYESMKFTMLEVDYVGMPKIGSYGNHLYSTFKQDAFILGLQGGIGIGLYDFLNLGVYFCYNLDVSSPSWEVNNPSAVHLPDTRLNGMLFGANIGFLIPLKNDQVSVEDFDY